MSTLVTIQGTDIIANSRTDINSNFSALNTDKIETSVLDTDTALTANSDSKIATQKAVKAYVDASGGVNASETSKGIVEEATDAEVQAGTATGGTGAKLFITPAKLLTNNNAPLLSATENLTVGVPVGISNISGGVARATRVVSTVAHGVTNQNFDGQINYAYAPIGGDKFVYALYSTDGADTLYAQVGSIDTSTLTMTLGTAVSVAAAFTPATAGSLRNVAICKLDTDKFIIFYLLDASTTVIKYRIGTVSGTTITLGSEATAITAGSTVASSNFFGADFISTDKGVFGFKAATSANSKVVVFTASGTVATFGTAVTPGTQSQIDNPSYIKKIGTDKFVLVTQDAANSIYGQVFTCSGGTTITSGAEKQIVAANATQTLSYLQVVSPTSDVFVVRYNRTSTTVDLVGCTVSTTTISNGSSITCSTTGIGGIYATSSTTVYITGTTSNSISLVTISGTTLTDAGKIFQTVSTATPEGTIYMDNSYPVCIDVGATNTSAWIYGMSNNFVGIAQTTVSKGTNVNVKVAGIDSNQTGLTPGAYYLVSSGALSFVSNQVTVNTLDDVNTVLAISSTQIKL